MNIKFKKKSEIKRVLTADSRITNRRVIYLLNMVKYQLEGKPTCTTDKTYADPHALLQKLLTGCRVRIDKDTKELGLTSGLK